MFDDITKPYQGDLQSLYGKHTLRDFVSALARGLSVVLQRLIKVKMIVSASDSQYCIWLLDGTIASVANIQNSLFVIGTEIIRSSHVWSALSNRDDHAIVDAGLDNDHGFESVRHTSIQLAALDEARLIL